VVAVVPPAGAPTGRAMARATASQTLAYWRSVALLRTDRPSGLAGLERCFLAGATPGRLDGFHEGSLLATTVGRGIDQIAWGLTRLWMPWNGKTFDPESSDGCNLFRPGFRVPMRILWPRQAMGRSSEPGQIGVFRFETRTGPCELDPRVHVLKIDYGIPESPALIRDILDEIVQIEDRLYLGQALLRWRGTYRRAAWFSLADVAPAGSGESVAF
jgi:hypothetical protein